MALLLVVLLGILLGVSSVASTNIFYLRYHTEVGAALTHAHMLGDCTVRRASNDAAPRVVDALVSFEDSLIDNASYERKTQGP